MTSQSVYKYPRLARRVDARRKELASEMLFSAEPADRSISAHLFVDAFLDRFTAAGECGDVDGLAAWLESATQAANPLSPPRAVVRAIVPVLQTECISDDIIAESLVPMAIVGNAVRVMDCARSERVAPSLDLVDAAVGRVMTLMEQRDPLTAEHSRAVASWCARIARRLGMSEPETVHCSRSGMLHDIGKIRVPLHILRAPRALRDDEWDMMRAHVDFGERIAVEDEVLAQFRPAIRYHHERIDGSGYPYGLAGNEIPFAARIVSVADAFNAMIGRRPYRAAILPSMALFELQRSKGTQFDPDIVDALESIVTATK